MTQTWIILGATSSIARAFARQVASLGHGVILAGRDMPDLQSMAQDCALRGAPYTATEAFDARKPLLFDGIVERLSGIEGQINAAVFVGSMPSQDQIDADPGLIKGMIADNFSGPAEFLQRLAPLLEQRGSGTIVGIGSVAGDRGRLGNYVYGAAKAGFHTYLSGLRNRLARSGAHVMTVKPGMVDTAMTWGLDGLVLVVPPEKIATDIMAGLKRQRNTVYSPGIWGLIMLIIRTIPEPIFKKLSI